MNRTTKSGQTRVALKSAWIVTRSVAQALGHEDQKCEYERACTSKDGREVQWMQPLCGDAQLEMGRNGDEKQRESDEDQRWQRGTIELQFAKPAEK